MIDEIKNADVYIGLKQSKKALAAGVVKKAFVACDAAAQIIAPFMAECEKKGVAVENTYTMHQLGEAAKIDIGASVIVIID